MHYVSSTAITLLDPIVAVNGFDDRFTGRYIVTIYKASDDIKNSHVRFL